MWNSVSDLFSKRKELYEQPEIPNAIIQKCVENAIEDIDGAIAHFPPIIVNLQKDIKEYNIKTKNLLENEKLARLKEIAKKYGVYEFFWPSVRYGSVDSATLPKAIVQKIIDDTAEEMTPDYDMNFPAIIDRNMIALKRTIGKMNDNEKMWTDPYHMIWEE